MRYLTLAEALVIAKEVTGLPIAVLNQSQFTNPLDSALHAPQAGSGGYDKYPNFVDKAAVLVVRIAQNHPLPDGNKRLAWMSLNMFCELNGYELQVADEDAVDLVKEIAAGSHDEVAVAEWLMDRLQRKRN